MAQGTPETVNGKPRGQAAKEKAEMIEYMETTKRRKLVASAVEAGVKINRGVASFIGYITGITPMAVLRDVKVLRGERTKGERFKDGILKRDRACQYCGLRTPRLVAEHVIPQKLGGPMEPHNIVAACWNCNALKRQDVWIPRNLAKITSSHPEWRAKIEASADTKGQAFALKYRKRLLWAGQLTVPAKQVGHTNLSAYLDGKLLEPDGKPA